MTSATQRFTLALVSAVESLDAILAAVETGGQKQPTADELAAFLAEHHIVDADTSLADALWEILDRLRASLVAVDELQERERVRTVAPDEEVRRLLAAAERHAADTTSPAADRARLLLETADRWKSLTGADKPAPGTVTHFGSGGATTEARR